MPETTIPETVSVSAESIVDVAAQMYSLAHRMFLNECSGMGEELDRIGSKVLHAAFPDGRLSQYPDTRFDHLANERSDVLTAAWARELAGRVGANGVRDA